ncbi:MAG: ABC transporter permease subunit, partial [Acidimicrobiia bacterium]|nr:ABC transporter permease subunit [Acidimicrobiia bacterium]
MEFLGDVMAWFTTADNWLGTTGILNRTWEHIYLSAAAVAVAGLIAVPAGVTLGHIGRGGVAAVSIVNIGRAVPSFGIVALALPITIKMGLGLGWAPTLLALVALALPPMFTNSYTGVHEVDSALVEAGRGMGMRGPEILREIELPAASPLILAAVRISSVQVVATATLGALVAWGGLGRFIIDGFARGDEVMVFAGGLLVALLAVLTEVFFSLIERVILPRGLQVARA